MARTIRHRRSECGQRPPSGLRVPTAQRPRNRHTLATNRRAGEHILGMATSIGVWIMTRGGMDLRDGLSMGADLLTQCLESSQSGHLAMIEATVFLLMELEDGLTVLGGDLPDWAVRLGISPRRDAPPAGASE